MQKCHCGLPLHYTDKTIEDKVIKIIKEKGEYIPITVEGGKTYNVQRHYIALHGIKAKELPMLGFKEV